MHQRKTEEDLNHVSSLHLPIQFFFNVSTVALCIHLFKTNYPRMKHIGKENDLGKQRYGLISILAREKNVHLY